MVRLGATARQASTACFSPAPSWRSSSAAKVTTALCCWTPGRFIAKPPSTRCSRSMRVLVVYLLLLSNFLMAQPKNEQDRTRYAVIGDSYSCGEGASLKESWPALLTQHLNAQGLHVDLVSNPSKTGWTTKDAIDRELPKFIRANPTFASLLIGVNDWVQGVDETTFRNRFSYLVDQMLALLPNKTRLLVVTIPDFGVTPTGGKYARVR